MAARLPSELFPGDLALLRSSLKDYWKQSNHSNGNVAPLGTLRLLVKQKSGKRWDVVKELMAAWAQTEIPTDRVLRSLLTNYVKREGLSRIALEILAAQNRRDGRLDPQHYLRRLNDLCMTFDLDQETRVDLESGPKNYFQEIDKGRVPTGITPIDKALGGGLGRGELGLVLAPAKRGKTAILVNFGAHAALQGLRVLHVTLEISRFRLLERFDMCIGGFTSDELRARPKRIQEARRKLRTSRGSLIIQDLSHERVDVERLQSVIEEQMPLSLVIVDYTALMQRSDHWKESNSTEDLGIITRDVRSLSSKFGLPIWTAAQVHRSAYDVSEFDMGNLATDFSQAFTCDVALCAMQSLEDREKGGFMRIRLDAQRSSASNPTVPVVLDLSHMRLQEVQEEAPRREHGNPETHRERSSKGGKVRRQESQRSRTQLHRPRSTAHHQA